MTDATARLCVGCGTEIVPNPRERNKRKWCSESCMQRERRKDPEFRNKERLRKNEANRREAELRRQTMARRVVVRRRPCGWCGALFEPARSDARYCKDRLCTSQRTHQAAKQRDPDYMRKRNAKQRGTQLRDRVTEFDCAWCGAPNIPGQTCAPHANKFCGKQCKTQWHNAEGMSKVQRSAQRRQQLAERQATIILGGARTFTSGICPNCGVNFLVPPWQSFGPYCSRKCSGSVKPKTRKKIPVSVRRVVYDRDSWTCGICQQSIDPAAPLGNWSASVDHIVPVSRGGTDHIDNLQAAHRWCNSVRRDRPLTAAF